MSRPQELLELIATLRDELAPAEEHVQAMIDQHVNPMKEKLRELRAELLEELTAGGLTGVKAGGLKASAVKREDYRIVDAYAVRQFLEEGRFLLDYVKLDDTKVIGLAKELPVPGVTRETRYDLRISEEKAK